MSLASVTADVISIHGRPEGERIRYRIVDEYMEAYGIDADMSDQPLTLRELIHLMDTVETPDPDHRTGLVEDFWCRYLQSHG